MSNCVSRLYHVRDNDQRDVRRNRVRRKVTRRIVRNMCLFVTSHTSNRNRRTWRHRWRSNSRTTFAHSRNSCPTTQRARRNYHNYGRNRHNARSH